MSEEETNLPYKLRSFEEKKALVSQLNLMDDIFFSAVMRDRAACEYLVSHLLEKKLKVIDNRPQHTVANIDKHSITLDLLVEDEAGQLYDVEIQGINEGNHERRVRYYQAAIDWSILEKGTDYSELPEMYMIFISKFDPFKEGKAHYEIVQSVSGSEKPYTNGVHIHYFNTSAQDGSEVSRLLRYLLDSREGCTEFGALSNAVNIQKTDKREVEYMSSTFEEYMDKSRAEGVLDGMAKGLAEGMAKGKLEGKLEGRLEGKLEGKLEIVKGMVDDGISLDKALEYAKLDRKTYEAYLVEGSDQ